MKHVSILVPNGNCILSSVVGAYKLFNKVNDYLVSVGKPHFYEVDLVGLTQETILYEGAFSIKPTKLIDEITTTDIIIITTINGDMPKELKNNAAFVPWIINQRIKHHTEIASLCVGAFLLAETGLLNGKSCATHWIAADNFKQMYPKINLVSDKIICEDNGIYSSGGAYSFLNLLLYIVEKHCGREPSIWCSKLFEIDYNRFSQSHFHIFNGQKEHDDNAILEAQNYIETHVEQKINVEELANKVAVSKRNFVRRFKKATANTPIEYIQRVKIEAAKMSLEMSALTINEVMYDVGYNDQKAFRTIFKKHTGISPNAYRIQYNREVSLI